MTEEWKFSLTDALIYGWQATRKYFFSLIFLAAITYIAVPWLFGVLMQTAGIAGLLIRAGSVLVTVFFLLIWTQVVLNKKTKTKKSVRQFSNVLGIYILRQIIVTVGFCLFIVPGIVWWIKYLYAPMLAVDKNLDVFEALAASRRLTDGQFWPLLAWFAVSMGLYALGLLCYKVGLLVVMPIVNHAGAYVYGKLSGKAASPISQKNVS